MVRRRGVAQACAERAPGVPVSAEGGNARRPHCRAAPVAAHSRGAERHRFAGCAHPAAPSLRRHGHPEQSVQQQADRHRPLRVQGMEPGQLHRAGKERQVLAA
ncbi:hypothetical protein G6F55_014059 [Rhizopus delemar]|nr:hypothetical protein G6F65_022271 [Rhizopus arrhizus]KAG1437672.1 hypothetical protein G6F55_014059 [Rhizopus delemar]